MEVNQGTLNSLHVAFSAIFNKALTVAESNWGAIAQRVTSTTRRNEFAWLRNMPQLKRDFGPKDFESLVRQSYSIANHRYGTFAEVDVDDIEDDNVGSYQAVFQQHATESAAWLGNAVMSMLPKGLTSDGKAFNGENFFSASHPKLGGGTFSNYDNDGGSNDAPWYLLCTTRGIKPVLMQERKPLQLTLKSRADDDNVFHDDKVIWGIKGRYGFGYSYPQLAYCSRKDLDSTNLKAAFKAMMELVRDDGTKINIMPDTLVVGPTNYWPAKELLENERNNAGASNIHKGSLKLVYSDFVESVSLDIAPAGG